jgi:hypothetical protein
MKSNHISGLLVACSALFSCGSVHQMIPPVPLAPGEFRGSMVISYDLNHFAPFSSFGMNFYWGTSSDYNIGFGYQPPLGISHFTAVKYFNINKTKYENLYASVNGILFNTDYSPNLEVGWSYLIKDNQSFHSISSGLWFLIDDDVTEPLWRMLTWPSTGRIHFNPKIRPFVRYDFSDNDFSLSICNNIGFAKRAVDCMRKRVEQRGNIILRNLDIAYVTFNAITNAIQIEMKDSTTYRITKNYPQLDDIIPKVEINKYRLNKFTPKDPSLGYYYIVTLKPDSKSPGKRRIVSSELYELNYDDILADFAAKKDIVIGSYPERTAEILRQIRWYKHDWSIGVGVRTRH